jgi:phosphatidate cytidylyltransferase
VIILTELKNPRNLNHFPQKNLTQAQIEARARLRQDCARYIEQDIHNNSTFKPNLTTLDLEEGATSQDLPRVVHNPLDAPIGPPWNYEPTPEELEQKKVKKEARAAKADKVKSAARDKTPSKLKHPSDLQVRFRTAVVYTLLTIICVMAGDIPTMLYLMVVAGICAGEFFYMLRHDAKLPNEALGCIGAVMYLPGFYFLGFTGVILVSVVLLLALLVWYVFWLRARVADVGISFFGAVYTGFLLCGLLLIRQSLDGVWAGLAVFLIFLSVWANDAFAYFAGSRFGRHKLAPRISPKKSWEGFIAGLVGSGACWVVLSFVPGINMPIWLAIVFGIICGLFEVLGDLAESRIKRNSGFKDSGTIMPGHGGLLDRCDSLFLASITSAFLLVVGGCINYAIF